MNKETGQPPEKVGIAMDVCHTCIEKAEAKIIAAAAATKATAPASAGGGGNVSMEPAAAAFVAVATVMPTATSTTKTTTVSAPATNNASGPNKKQASLTSAKTKVVHRKDKDMKGPPRAGTVLYTVKEKLGMVKIWKDTANGTGRKSALARKWQVSSRAVERWVKDEVKLEKQIEEGRGGIKAMISDPLRRIVHGLNQFYEANARMPRDLKLPLTGEFV